MAIQFFCPGCKQPIEIDDDAANQAVTCPYCQKVVTAPAQGDAAIALVAPTARPPESPTQALPLPYSPMAPAASNKLGWAALSCAALLVVCMGISVVIAAYMAKDVPQGTAPPEAAKILQKKMQSPGLTVFSIFGTCAVPIVGAALAIASLVRKGRPRWPAIVTIVVLALYTVMVCLGVMYAVSQAAGKAA
jgi:hypothetical protein